MSEVSRHDPLTDDLQTRIWTAKVRMLVILTTTIRLVQAYRRGQRISAKVRRVSHNYNVSHAACEKVKSIANGQGRTQDVIFATYKFMSGKRNQDSWMFCNTQGWGCELR